MKRVVRLRSGCGPGSVSRARQKEPEGHVYGAETGNGGMILLGKRQPSDS